MFYVYADGNLIYQPAFSELLLFSPKLTLEIGKAGSLEFMIPKTNSFYNQLRQLKTVITVLFDRVEIFRGRVLTISKDFNNMRKVYCEGNLAYLVDSLQPGEKFEGTTHEFFTKIINNHNACMEPEKQFVIGDITIADRDIIISGTSDEIADAETGNIDYDQIAINSESKDWKTSFEYIDSYLIAYTGGYLRTRRVDGVTYIDLLEDYGSTAVQEIEFGKNLLDLTEEISTDELFTVLIPIGDDNLTIASVNGGSPELVDEEAVAKYGRILKTNVFDNVNDPNTLKENGLLYLERNMNIPITIEAKAVDMHFIDSNITAIYIGDSVHINSVPHGISQDLTCTKIDYDLENPANTNYTFGTVRQSLTERYKKDKDKHKGGGGGAAEAADDEATQKIDKIYNAYIDVRPEDGAISLKALYEELQNDKTILNTTCGIDLNAPQGNINIKTIRKDLDDLNDAVSYKSAQITQAVDDNRAAISLVTSYYEGLNEREAGHFASISLRSDALESSIALKADTIDIDAKILKINGKISNLEADFARIDDIIARKIDTAIAEISECTIHILHTHNISSDYISGDTILATGALRINQKDVATQEWVIAQLENYAASNHTHSYSSLRNIPVEFKPLPHKHKVSVSKDFNNGHTHKVTVNGTQYTTGGVSTNVTHSLNYSGYTGLTPYLDTGN